MTIEAEPADPGTEGRDLTEGPVARTLFAFAIPTLGSSILQSLNGSINAVWVSHYLGENALAATSNANLVMFLMLATMFGFGMAATILVGHHVGRNDLDGARRTMATTMGTFVVVSSLIALLGWIATPAILRLLATPPEALPFARDYLRVIFLGMPASFVMSLLIMGLRGAGDAMTPLWFMAVSAVIDVTLNPLLIGGLGPIPAMGIAGSAAATLIASWVALFALIGFVQVRDLPLRLRGAEWRYLLPDITRLRPVVTKGVPMGLQILVVSLSALAMIGLINRAGVATTAAYGVTSQLWTYIQMPAMAIGSSVSAMAAQNIGAGHWDRVSLITRAGISLNIVLTGAMVILVTIFDHTLLGLFLPPASPAMPIAQHINLVVSWSFIVMGIGLVLSGVMRANGVVLVPLAILVITTIPFRLGLALTFMPRFGTEAVWGSFVAATLFSALLNYVFYASGRWRRAKGFAPHSALEEREQSLAASEPAGRMQPTG